MSPGARSMGNLTDCSLTPSQEEVLKLGLNFALAPTKFFLVDTMAAVEEGARKLMDTVAEDLRGWVCRVLRWAKLPKDNLNKEQRRALKELKQNSTTMSPETKSFQRIEYM